MTKPTNAKTPQLSVAQIDVARARIMNELDGLRAHLDEMAYASAVVGGDEKAMIEAKDVITVVELKLQGLAAARAVAVEEEERQRVAAAAARRREQAVKIRVQLGEYSAEMSGIGSAIHELKERVRRANVRGELLRTRVLAQAHDDREMDSALQTLVCAGAIGEGNVPFLVESALKKTPDMAGYMIGSFDNACRLLSRILPEMLDESVIAEAENILDENALALLTQTVKTDLARAEEQSKQLACLNEPAP